MSQALCPYYERELRFIRRMAGDFARQYPREAGRLGLEADRSTDPHVERMIEAFALLAARVHLKLDDEFPELTDAMLGVLYPHYLAPVPSLAMVQFDVGPGQADSPTGDAKLMSPPFPRTAVAPSGAKALLRLRIDALGAQPPAGLELDTLRLYLSGDGTLTATLYELIFNNVAQVVIRDATAPPGGPSV